MQAAALAKVTHPPVRSFWASTAGTWLAFHWATAYEGLPGPANTYDASRRRASMVS